MTANSLILIAVIVAAMVAMTFMRRGLPGRYKWWGATYGMTKTFSDKDIEKPVDRDSPSDPVQRGE